MRKIIPYILILLVMLPVGLFSLVPKAEAQEGSCQIKGTGQNATTITVRTTQADCATRGGTFYPDGTNTPFTPTPSVSTNDENNLEKNLESCVTLTHFSIAGCFQWLIYIFFVTLPSWLLIVVAKFFNFMAGITLSSDFYGADFIEKIWIVIRDFANIFFILVLLYAAFQIILDIGHGGGKKIIASVILIALVVNFSLFFTKIIIDASNVVALVFYNRIDTSNVASYDSIGSVPGIPEKDMAGALVSSFNVNAFFDDSLMEKLREPKLTWKFSTMILPIPAIQNYNPYMLMGMMVVYGIVIYALCYAFLIAGLSFLGRMLTLMMLMMVSPLAFVSIAVPGLKGVDTIGFDSWIKNLIKSSFVAAIFIFLIYIISIILNAKIFDQLSAGGTKGPVDILILLFVPAIMIVILLVKGAAYAKKASGEFSGAVISGAKVVGSLALGGAALGTAVAGRATVGTFMKGASTGDSANQRLARGEVMRGRWDTIKGVVSHYGTGGLLTRAQQVVGRNLNADQQRVEGYAHARRTLNDTAQTRFHKKYEDLTRQERDEVQTTIDRNIVARQRFGNRNYAQLNDGEQLIADTEVLRQRATGGVPHGGAELARQAIGKQGVWSTVKQASRVGSYDVRGIADAVAKEYNTGFTKLATGLTAAIASSLRGGFKQMGVNYGSPQGVFFKDLGNTISEALKSAKINVDLSHVGEEKKEGHGGGGHH